jgi:hypothetical protein
MVKEHPMLFTGEMVRAILRGDKTQTRRVVTSRNSEGGSFPVKKLDVNKATYQPPCFDSIPYLKAPVHPDFYDGWMDETWHHRIYSRIRPGHRIWVREKFGIANSEDGSCILYPANHDRGYIEKAYQFENDLCQWAADVESGAEGRYRPSIHMPRWASRILLEVEDVRPERVQDISAKDAEKEGCPPCEGLGKCSPCDGDCASNEPLRWFQALWESINAKRGFGWNVNPWNWVYTFRILEGK